MGRATCGRKSGCTRDCSITAKSARTSRPGQRIRDRGRVPNGSQGQFPNTRCASASIRPALQAGAFPWEHTKQIWARSWDTLLKRKMIGQGKVLWALSVWMGRATIR